MSEANTRGLWRVFGLLLQALVLGSLLALAVAHMILARPGGSVFRYEGF